MADGNTTIQGRAVGEVVVWDLPIRAFHWCLVVLVTVAVVTAKLGRMEIHMLAGEAILVLLLFRLVWGVIGSQTARFSQFVRGPRAVFAYAADLLRGRTGAPVLGHNPIGALMVLALLAALAVQAASGLFTSDDILVDGPLVPLAASSTVKTLSTLHRTLADGILVLVGVHVLAVFAYLLVKKENLVRPMITGRKAVPAADLRAAPKRTPAAVALAVLAAAAGLVALAVRAV